MPRYVQAVLILAALAPPAIAQTNKAVEVVPDNALGFVLIKDLRQLSDKVDHVAKKLEVKERVSLLELIDKEMGIHEGINANGTAVFIVMKGHGKDSIPGFVFALPVADFQKLAEQLDVKQLEENTVTEGKVGTVPWLIAGIGGAGPDKESHKFPVAVAKRGEFVLITTREGKADLEAILKSQKSIASLLPPVQDWLDKFDIWGICTDHGVSAGLAMGLNGPGGGVEGSSPGQAAHMKSVFADVEKNVKLIAFGGLIGKDGDMQLATAIHFQPDGSFAKWIANAEPLQDTILSAFPNQPYLAACFARISPQMTFEGLGKLIFADLPAKEVDELTRRFVQLIQQVSEIGSCTYAVEGSGRSIGPLTLIGDDITVAHVKDSGKFMDDVIDLVQSWERANGAKRASKIKINCEKKEISGKPSRLVTVEGVEGGPVTFLLAATDPHTVLSCFLKDPGQVDSVIKKFSGKAEPSLGANAQLQQTRKVLPDKLQLEAFIDLQAFGILNSNEAPKKLVSKVAPLGFSMRALPAGLEAQFVIPFDALKAVVDATKMNEKPK